MDLLREAADVSVRPAVPGDEDAIARIQVSAWRAAHGAALGDALDLVDLDAVRTQWAAAVSAPPSGHRVLVACDGPTVVGFAAFATIDGDPPGGVVLALEVQPVQQRSGHGSRLLAACVDLLRESGADQLQTWVLDGDDAREQFLGGAGLGPDGTTRTLASGMQADGTERVVTEHRWWASI